MSIISEEFAGPTTCRWVRLAMSLRYGDRCLACGVRRWSEVDHVVPRSWGGPDHTSNYQPLCRDCNREKGNRESTDYRLWTVELDIDGATEAERDAQAHAYRIEYGTEA